MAHQDEPSVEDILASIKQVIARDSREASAMRFAPAPSAEPVDDEEAEDVLELGEAGQMVDPDGEGDSDAEEPLLTDAASAGMRESLAALAMLAEPGAKPQIVRSGETSLEGLVREMLRPMLAQWLDTNLPPLVERMVRAEIARIAGKQR